MTRIAALALLIAALAGAGCSPGEKSDEEVAASRNGATPQGTISDSLPNLDLLPGPSIATPANSAAAADTAEDETEAESASEGAPDDASAPPAAEPAAPVSAAEPAPEPEL